jgi:hypothetical protein
VVAVGPTTSTPQGARHRRLQLRWWQLPDLAASTPRWSAIDVFNFHDDCCRTCRQHPPGGPPSMSSTSVVAAARPTASTLRGPPSTSLISEPPAPAPPGAPPSTSPTSEPPASAPPRARRQLRSKKDKITERSIKKLAPLMDSQPLSRWVRGLCRHPEDRVPPHISFKSRQAAGRVSTRYNTNCSFGPHLLVEVGSGAVTCPMASDLTFLLR